MLLNLINRNIPFAIYFCLLFCSLNTFAAKWATVVVDQAVIYSDIQMKSKIGFVRKGKKVRVGEVARNKGRLLPLVINKRVVYIKVNDLSISADLVKLESVTERFVKKMNTPTSNKRLSLYTGVFYAGMRKSSFETPENEISELYGAGLSGYYFDLKNNRVIKISFETMQTSVDGIDYRIYSIPLGLRVFNHERSTYSFDVYAGAVAIPFMDINVDNELVLNSQGIGGHISSEYVLNISKSFYLHFEASFEMIKLFNQERDSTSSLVKDLSEQLNGILYGPRALVKLSYQY